MGVKLVLHSVRKSQIESENKVMKTVFVAKTEEVTGGWKSLHNTEFRNLYSSPSLIRAVK
jgi:hypothetical protein